MKRTLRVLSRMAPVLLAFLFLATASSVAQADDFIRRPDVPSSRDNIRPAAKAKTTPKAWQNIQNTNKIVKSTKTGNNSQGAPATPPASIQ